MLGKFISLWLFTFFFYQLQLLLKLFFSFMAKELHSVLLSVMERLVKKSVLDEATTFAKLAKIDVLYVQREEHCACREGGCWIWLQTYYSNPRSLQEGKPIASV